MIFSFCLTGSSDFLGSWAPAGVRPAGARARPAVRIASSAARADNSFMVGSFGPSGRVFGSGTLPFPPSDTGGVTRSGAFFRGDDAARRLRSEVESYHDLVDAARPRA